MLILTRTDSEDSDDADEVLLHVESLGESLGEDLGQHRLRHSRDLESLHVSGFISAFLIAS